MDSKSNIFGAGHATPPGPGANFPQGAGLLPPGFSFPAGPDNVFAIAKSEGTVSCCGGPSNPSRFNNADGHPAALSDAFPCGDRTIQGFTGISGITDKLRYMFLVGAFLDDSEPADPQPALLEFTNNHDFTDIFPELRQVFFIGDGRTANGDVQAFHAPKEATRLFLGFADAVCFTGLPGGYADNSGALTVTVTLAPAVTIAQASFNAKWRESRLRGELVIAGTFRGESANLTATLARKSGKGKGKGKAFPLSVGAGAFKKSVPLPATLLPGAYVLHISGKSGEFSVSTQDIALSLPAPPEGIVDTAYVSGLLNGPPATRLTGRWTQMFAHFHFVVPPKSKAQITTTWVDPGGRSLGTVPKARSVDIVTTLQTTAPFPNGVWYAELRVGKVVVKRVSIRVG